MARKALKCPGCQGTLEVEDNLEFAFCIYCGTKIDLVDTRIKVGGTVGVDGIAGEEALLLRADQALENNNVEGASKIYKEVLAIAPQNYRAWLGRYLCEMAFASYYNFRDDYGNTGPQVKAGIISRLLDDYGMRAYEYAPEEAKQRIRQLLEEDIDTVKSLQSGQSQPQEKKKGCYIATAAYGSYHAPQVVTLRWYRDHVLQRSALGRLFIRAYYLCSPHLVRWLGGWGWLSRAVRTVLDGLVARIRRRGGR